ncbi:MAG: Hsp20/alpha crystallin family protein, partial [Chloroflexi bacterium]|nr:Hsp20/alpha crystallin family protein [Chloroflexota bacterium]
AMDQLFERSFVHPHSVSESGQNVYAPMDVCETEQGYEVNVSLPGVKPEDIEVTVNQNTLTVRGSYRSSYPQEQSGQEGQTATQSTGQAEGANQASTQPQQQGSGTSQSQQRNWLMREISSGSFERSITFARPIDADNIQTSCEHGMLKITIPISPASRPRRINVNTGQSQSQQGQVEAGQRQS